MKKGNARTVKKYISENGRSRIRYAVEVRFNGIWRQAVDPEHQEVLVYDLEYDACARLLSAFEKRII